MVNFKTPAFGLKTGKLIEKLKKEPGFFLAATDDGWQTIFGNGHTCYIVPFPIGEETNPGGAEAVKKVLADRIWSEDAMKHMRWVPLPNASDLKPGRSMEHPTHCHLAATDMLAAEWAVENMPCATYPFDVDARYLKMALQLAKFSGHKDTRLYYNPLCLWAEDDSGNEIRAVIMPMRR